MPKVKIEAPEGGGSYGTAIYVDGKELQPVRSIDVSIGLNEPVAVSVELVPEEGVEIVLPAAEVNLIVVPTAGLAVEVTQEGDMKRYRFVRTGEFYEAVERNPAEVKPVGSLAGIWRNWRELLR